MRQALASQGWRIGALALALALCASQAAAQSAASAGAASASNPNPANPANAVTAASWPSRAVRLVVPSAPGGGTDILGRALAQKMSENLGQQVVVENRAGAGTVIGSELVARSAPDGYSLLISPSTLAIDPALHARLAYDPLRDFSAVSLVATVPNVLVVHPSVPAASIAELLALARAKPGSLNYASAGIGTSPHLAAELFRAMTGVDLVHVPYKGTTPGVVDLLAGRVSLMFPNVLTALPHLRAGKLRALGVTGSSRSAVLPDVPAISEGDKSLSGYEASQWYGVLAPAGTPPELVLRIQREIARALQAPALRERLAAEGAQVVGGTPQEFATLLAREIAKWARLVQAAGIRPE